MSRPISLPFPEVRKVSGRLKEGDFHMKKRITALILALVLLVPCAFASAETYYRMKDRAKLRQLPNYDCVTLDSYRADWALTVNNKVDKKWVYITYTNGKSGYMEASHIAKCSTTHAWVKKDDTKLRKGPDYNFATIAKIQKGEKVTVLTTGRSYNYVKTSQGYGYMAASDLSKKKVSPSGGGGGGGSVSYSAYVTSKGGTVGLRSAPSGSKTVVIQNVPYATAITVLYQYNGTYSYVSVNGTEGYMRSKYITKNKPAPLPTAKPTPAPFVPYTTTAKADTKGNTPRLYQGDGAGYSSVKIAVGATVSVIAKSKKDIYWVKVEVNGQPGYMPLKFLN